MVAFVGQSSQRANDVQVPGIEAEVQNTPKRFTSAFFDHTSTFHHATGGREQRAVQRQTKFHSLPWCNDLPTMPLSSEQLDLTVHLASKRLLVFELRDSFMLFSSLARELSWGHHWPWLRSDAVSFHHHDHARLRLSMIPPLCSPGELS